MMAFVNVNQNIKYHVNSMYVAAISIRKIKRPQPNSIYTLQPANPLSYRHAIINLLT